jgi:hypothetical protein
MDAREDRPPSAGDFFQGFERIGRNQSRIGNNQGTTNAQRVQLLGQLRQRSSAESDFGWEGKV